MSGTDYRKQLICEGPVIILVEPQLGDNIGMVARAMANFGLWELRLVNPRDGWPNERANAAASRADHVIEATKVFDNLPDAIGDLKYVLATTARKRDMLKNVLGPQEAVGNLRQYFRKDMACGILFGRERWGLHNDEVALADAIVTFPVNPAFASLNIAQAVLLISYEWMKSGHTKPDETAFEAPQTQVADKSELQSFFEHLDSALNDAKYYYPEVRRARMTDNLRSIFTHAGLKQQELQTLHGVIAALERRWLVKRNSRKK
ncbi:MAG: RNA methyltransferase [Rhizobiaceae bacterium]|nr:RNA methyltransferase [Rhizobiaceae bacterium]